MGPQVVATMAVVTVLFLIFCLLMMWAVGMTAHFMHLNELRERKE